MAPPIGGVDSGGRRRDLSLTDMAAISGSWVSYIFTNLANFRTPESEEEPRSMGQNAWSTLKDTDKDHVGGRQYCEADFSQFQMIVSFKEKKWCVYFAQK